MNSITVLCLLSTCCVSAIASRVPLSGRIVDGEAASINNHPYVVSLREKSEETYNHFCGGGILNKRIILTAAHCLYGRNAKDLVVVAGSNYSFGSLEGQILVQRIIVHENFSNRTVENDIGLVVLNSDLGINGYSVKSLPLSPRNPQAGDVATVMGWGALRTDGAMSAFLRSVNIKVVDHDICKETYRQFKGLRVTEHMFCAGGGTKDSCQGDSGGPVIINNNFAGVVSWGLGCGKPGIPGVYTTVSKYYKWLTKKMSEATKFNK